MTTRRRHVPIRTCVICGNKAAKRELVRIVAGPSGVAIDEGGKAPGRGGYVCGDGNCMRKGLKKGRLEYALRTTISDQQWEALVSSLGALTGAQ